MPTGYPGRTHGLVGTYISGCRCDDCRLAASRYYHKHTREEWYTIIEAKHGTESRSKRCKCDECRKAADAARKRRRIENGPGPNAKHGTNATYSSGCRCDDCRRGHADYTRQRRRARKAETDALQR